ncbi:hypothetical protein FF125_08710 [Aureibaculum algae]|uniref:Uncharacterized protein n=1 Tax=Aureibaculum algae TaxID=2584122 RepID=A0A5B7TU89_9FLAO|nr:hypothetical protein [Aureibaculum algae]QCX38507.1 hypothetical protein FF125_08710 [Aureibaculum algae]
MKRSFVVISIMISIFVVSIIIDSNEYKEDNKYYKEVNLKLKGKITEVKPLTYEQNLGIIVIEITESNIQNYDERKSLKRYLGVIKNNKANLVFNSISSVKKGDSIVLNIQNYKLYRNGKLIEENVIRMPPKSFIFTPFKEINTLIDL